MKRLMEKTVFSGLVTAWRLATWPTSRSSSFVKATTEGVVRPPSELGITPGSPPLLDRSRCQVGGVNQNYTSRTGTLYHIQVEDRGPVLDRVSEQEVRRLSIIVYANYGEPNARIIHGRDHDFPDVRTHEHNRLIEQKVQELAAQARDIIEEKEDRQVARIKALVREY